VDKGKRPNNKKGRYTKMALKKPVNKNKEVKKEVIKEEEVKEEKKVAAKKPATKAKPKPAPKEEKEEVKEEPAKEPEKAAEELYPEVIETKASNYVRQDKMSYAELKEAVNGSVDKKIRVLVHEPGRKDGKKLTEFVTVFVNKYMHIIDINSDNKTDDFESQVRVTKVEFEARKFADDGGDGLPFAVYLKESKVKEEPEEKVEPKKETPKGRLRRGK
jgi:hypothetical protein